LQGYIKLKKDPKSEKFGIRNVILKESVLKYTDWVIGFVIFANQDCFISKNSPKKTFQIEIDDLEKILNFINLALFFQIIIFAIVTILLFFAFILIYLDSFNFSTVFYEQYL